MAVVIQNITDNCGGEYGKGKQTYTLGINFKIFCEFTHNFEDGLAECLRKAADAFEKYEKGKDSK